jgi:hypothetical protein
VLEAVEHLAGQRELRLQRQVGDVPGDADVVDTQAVDVLHHRLDDVALVGRLAVELESQIAGQPLRTEQARALDADEVQQVRIRQVCDSHGGGDGLRAAAG